LLEFALGGDRPVDCGLEGDSVAGVAPGTLIELLNSRKNSLQDP
jgi:hypothetical protein